MARKYAPNAETPPTRYPVNVTRSGDAVYVTTDCGRELTRVLRVPARLFDRLGELCLLLLSRAEAPDAAGIPLFPGSLRLAEGRISGVCRVVLDAHRLEGGKVERVISLYDEGDDTAPALTLVEEQIIDFLGRG